MNHPDKPVRHGDDDDDNYEDYAAYLIRCHVHWLINPPAAPEGFELIHCDATPRHNPMYVPTDDDFYPPTCPGCSYDAVYQQHRYCEHNHTHKRRHRSSRLYRWLAHQMYPWLVKGSTWSMGNGCDGCTVITHWRWTKTKR